VEGGREGGREPVSKRLWEQRTGGRGGRGQRSGRPPFGPRFPSGAAPSIAHACVGWVGGLGGGGGAGVRQPTAGGGHRQAEQTRKGVGAAVAMRRWRFTSQLVAALQLMPHGDEGGRLGPETAGMLDRGGQRNENPGCRRGFRVVPRPAHQRAEAQPTELEPRTSGPRSSSPFSWRLRWPQPRLASCTYATAGAAAGPSRSAAAATTAIATARGRAVRRRATTSTGKPSAAINRRLMGDPTMPATSGSTAPAAAGA
jgi:hypothetical protein